MRKKSSRIMTALSLMKDDERQTIDGRGWTTEESSLAGHPFVRRKNSSPCSRLCYLLAAITWLNICFLCCGCKENAEKGSQEESAVVIDVVTAKPRRIQELLTRVGTIRAAEIVEVSPEIAGIVSRVHFQEGDKIESDQLLFSLDDSKLKKQLAAQKALVEEARSRAEFAELMYQRFDQLLKEDAVAVAERDRRKTELETARAQIDRLEAEKMALEERLKDTKIHAPMKGVVSEAMVDPGDFVKAGQILTVLYSLVLEARFSVPQSYASRVSEGQKVDIHVGFYPDEVFSGTVSFTSPGVDEKTRTFLTKAVIEDTKGTLKSGMFTVVDLILQTRKDNLVIPSEALVATQTGYVVYVVLDGAAYRRSVQIGLRRPGEVEIVSGLKEGETVALSGQMRLADGTKVAVGEETADKGESQADAQGQSDMQTIDSEQRTAK